jgi:hypothetical protein
MGRKDGREGGIKRRRKSEEAKSGGESRSAEKGESRGEKGDERGEKKEGKGDKNCAPLCTTGTLLTWQRCC